MPSAFRHGPYRFFFWSKENHEPPHVHVKWERMEAKFWLHPLVELAENWGFAPHEFNVVRRLVEEDRELLLESWDDHFG